jgi:hypothetical protein
MSLIVINVNFCWDTVMHSIFSTKIYLSSFNTEALRNYAVEIIIIFSYLQIPFGNVLVIQPTRFLPKESAVLGSLPVLNNELHNS